MSDEMNVMVIRRGVTSKYLSHRRYRAKRPNNTYSAAMKAHGYGANTIRQLDQKGIRERAKNTPKGRRRGIPQCKFPLIYCKQTLPDGKLG